MLIKYLSSNISLHQSIGIIAPYKAQIEKIRHLVMNTPALDNVRENISVNTVDAFQGQERDVIYISLTRSNEKNEIGFLKEYRRMNVAMTRARTKLVILGDSGTLGKDGFYHDVLDYAQKLGATKAPLSICMTKPKTNGRNHNFHRPDILLTYQFSLIQRR